MKHNLTDKDLAALLAENLDSKNKRDMEREINNDRARQHQFDDYNKIWKESPQVSKFEKIDTENDWKIVRRRMGFENKSKKIPLRKYFLRISAILILAF